MLFIIILFIIINECFLTFCISKKTPNLYHTAKFILDKLLPLNIDIFIPYSTNKHNVENISCLGISVARQNYRNK